MAGRLRTTVVIGRSRELAALDDARASVDQTGAGQVVVITGEAGMGKSRLVEEYAARHDDTFTVTGHCVDFAGDAIAYAPWTELLWWLIRDAELDLTRSQRDQLARLLPELLDTDAPSTSGSRELLYETIVEVLHVASTGRLLTVVVEDTHWIDTASGDLLLHIVRNLRRVPILLVATRRPTRTDALGDLPRQSLTEIELAAFDETVAADITAQLLGREPDDPDVAQVVERAAGNPLFLEELVAALDDDRLPATIRKLLLSRFNGLDADAQLLVRTAGVIGNRSPRTWLVDATGLDRDAARQATRVAVDAGVFVTDDSRRGYVFAHALLRDAILDDLLPDELIDLHETVARSLSERLVNDPDIDTAAELAFHWDAAEEPTEALRWAMAAARQAEHRYALHSAFAHYERALHWWDAVAAPEETAEASYLELLAGLASTAGSNGDIETAFGFAQRGVATATTDAAKIAAIVEFGSHYWSMGKHNELLDTSEGLLATVNGVEPGLRSQFLIETAEILIETGGTMHSKGEVKKGFDLLEPALRAAEESGVPRHIAHAYRVLTRVSEGAGDEQRCATEYDLALSIARENNLTADRALIAYNAACAAAGFASYDRTIALLDETDMLITTYGEFRLQIASSTLRCEAQTMQGHIADARETIEGLETGSYTGMAANAYHAARAFVANHAGDSAMALDDAREAALTTGSDIQRIVSGGHVHIEALIGLGRLDEAVAVSASIVPAVTSLHEPYNTGLFVMSALRACADNDDAEVGSQVAELWRRLREHGTGGCRLYEAFDVAIDAEWARLTGDDVGVYTRHAKELFAEVGVPYYVTYWEWREAEAHIAAGDRDAAISLLRRARQRASRCGLGGLERAIEQTVRTEQLRLGKRADESDELLTARELAVLRLLAEGKSNPEIADELIVSRRTARAHVSNILAKLGVATRTEAVSVAHQRHIL